MVGSLTGGAAGEVVYQSATNTTSFTAVGTSGQVLTSAGAGTPTWTTATSANTNSAIVQRDGSGNFSAGNVTAKQFTDTIVSTTASSGTTSLIWNAGAIINVTMNASTNFDVNSLATATAGQTLTLIILQGASAPFTATWSTVAWPSGTAPTLSTIAGKKDIITLFYDGTTFYGFVGGQNY
jgi:hypothetical protein